MLVVVWGTVSYIGELGLAIHRVLCVRRTRGAGGDNAIAVAGLARACVWRQLHPFLICDCYVSFHVFLDPGIPARAVCCYVRRGHGVAMGAQVS